MTYPYALALLIAPGALLAFTPLCGSFAPDLRLAAAFALSPLVMAAELVIAAVFGISFATFLRLIVPLNLIGLYPVVKSLGGPCRARIAWPDVLIPLTIMAPVAALLWAVPHLREYGWHNMMQLAAIQQIRHLPQVPEEMDLAGLRLNYGWLGYTQLTVLSAMLDRPATLLFPGLNILHFICLFRFLVAAADQNDVSTVGLRWEARLATGVFLLSTTILPVAVAVIASPGYFPGETRVTPFTGKYLYIDSMIYGLTCFALLVYAMTRALHECDASLLSLIPLAALACGICYPLLFPACVVAIGCFGALLLAGILFPDAVAPHYPVRAVTRFGIVAVLAGVVVIAYLRFLGADSVGLAVHLANRPGVLHRAWLAMLAFGVAALLLLPAAGQLWRRGPPPGLLNLGISILLVLSFCVLSLPLGVEYKFLFGGLLFLTPLLVLYRRRFIVRPARSLLVMASALVLVDGIAAWTLRHNHMPPGLTDALPLDETTAVVRPLNGWGGGWLQAVRDKTPADTVLLNGDSQQPVSVFTDRAAYVAADGSNGPRIGYSMGRVAILQEVKGYSRAELRARLDVLRVSFAARAPLPELDAAMAALARLHRPVAVHFEAETALQKLLSAAAIGRPIFAAGAEIVWLIRPEQFPTADR